MRASTSWAKTARTNDSPWPEPCHVDRALQHAAAAAMAPAQCPRRIDDLDTVSGTLQTLDVPGKPVRLVGVVDQHDAFEGRKPGPVPDAKVGPDEDERSTPRKA